MAVQTLVRSVVSTLPTALQRGSAVYSSACFKHCTSDIGSFWGVRVQGMRTLPQLACLDASAGLADLGAAAFLLCIPAAMHVRLGCTCRTRWPIAVAASPPA